MRLRSFAWMILLLSTPPSMWLSAQIVAPANVSADRALPGNMHVPMTFEGNEGQTGGGVKFLSRGKGYTAFLTAGGMVLSLRPSQPVPAQATSDLAALASNSQPPANAVLQFKLLGAAQNPVVVGEQPLPGKVNYFIGRDPAQWHTNISTYARVRYKNVYPGIDLVYYGSNQQLEYDFAVAPGANPGLVQFEITGASQVNLDASGNLVLETNAGQIHFKSPLIYQESNSSRVPAAGTYVINDSTHISFHVAQYDSTKPLVIDPVLVYSTYLGGSGDEQPAGVAVDASGNVYIAGYTTSVDFPLATLGALPSGQPHVFVAELDPTGSNLIYADYIGGSGQDYAYALVLDSAADVYVTGSTASSDFPLVNPYQGTYPGSFNGFLTQVAAGGSSLLYSTYLGGNGSDQPASIAIDGLGEAIVAGNTTSTNFPVANAYQATMAANDGGVFGNYGFITKFSSNGSSLVYSTYLGGNSNVPLNCGSNSCWPSPFNGVYGVAVDSSGNAYATGSTNTSNFPATEGAYLTTNSTQQNAVVGFVSKFSTSGALDYSTYLYESSGLLTNLTAIAVDSSGSAYVTGAAVSDGTYPITSTSICDPSVYGWGCGYSFVTKFDPTGSTLSYSTFLGPNNYASPAAIALDASNDAYIVASTANGSFPLVNGIEAYPNGDDLLLVEIDPVASTELLATYLGGSGDDYASGIALDAAGNIYVAGSTDSADFPVTPGAFQTVLGGGADAFLLKIAASAAPAVAPTPGSLQFALQAVGSTSQPQTVLLRNMGSSALSISSIITTGDFAETNTCGTSVPAAGNCTLSATFTPTAAGSRIGSIVMQDDAAGSPHVINLSGSGAAAVAVLTPTSLTFSAQQLGTSSASQVVTLANNGNAVLSVGTIQTTGDFAQTNNCPASLAASASCNINITFAPTSSGARSGILTVNDNSSGGFQAANLSGSGIDFSLTSSASSNSIAPGSTASYTLTITPVGGSFASAVKLACTGLPAQASCNFSPSSVTPGANNATATLSISTTAAVATAVPFRPLRTGPMLAAWIQLQGIGLFGMILFARRRSTIKCPPRFLLILLTAALIFMTGCAGGTGIASQSQPGTTPGTYSITVTGTSGNLQHSLPLTLTVQ